MNTTDKKIKIEIINVCELTAYGKNARTHSDSQVAQIAASIREFGFTNPVLIDGDSGIIAGHGRVMAAQKLGLKEVPCLRLDHLTDVQRRAYIIADNKLALNAGWDDEMLRLEIEDLRAEGFDLDLTGFTAEEIGALSQSADEIDLPDLPDGDKEPFQQMAFILHDSQAEQVKRAMDAAKGMGPFLDSPNENSNGNALARIAETFLTHHGDR